MGASPGLARHFSFGGVPRMMNLWIAGAAALFLWWFSTGAILWRVRVADRQGGDAHLWSAILGLPLLFAGVIGLEAARDDATVWGTYIAFLSALAVWGWIELAFLSGIVTGPNRRPCPPGAGLAERFLRATGTILWHEVVLVLALVLIGRMTLGAVNETGLWTFALLFFARLSAKLNLFFGVPRIHTEFLPKPLAHLASHFRRAPMNGFFPVSVTALTLAAGGFMERAATAPTEAAFVGHVLLSALAVLAVAEHWFMVLPLPDQKLWSWALPPAPSQTAAAPAEAIPTART
jgi:putative photosynthetic complex assembly protein 2